jgi:hypothetical protein
VHGDGALSSLSRGDVALSFFVVLSFAIRDCVVATPITTKTLITFDPNPNYLIQIFRLLLAKVVTSADKMTNMVIIKLSFLLFYFFKRKRDSTPGN